MEDNKQRNISCRGFLKAVSLTGAAFEVSALGLGVIRP